MAMKTRDQVAGSRVSACIFFLILCVMTVPCGSQGSTTSASKDFRNSRQNPRTSGLGSSKVDMTSPNRGTATTITGSTSRPTDSGEVFTTRNSVYSTSSSPEARQSVGSTTSRRPPWTPTDDVVVSTRRRAAVVTSPSIQTTTTRTISSSLSSSSKSPDQRSSTSFYFTDTTAPPTASTTSSTTSRATTAKATTPTPTAVSSSTTTTTTTTTTSVKTTVKTTATTTAAATTRTTTTPTTSKPQSRSTPPTPPPNPPTPPTPRTSKTKPTTTTTTTPSGPTTTAAPRFCNRTKTSTYFTKCLPCDVKDSCLDGDFQAQDAIEKCDYSVYTLLEEGCQLRCLSVYVVATCCHGYWGDNCDACPG
ncbi:cell wall protein DAN4-like, partial [Aplysia californica]|uniref:Cell wall protein DAN4-like n=1 Tax=Aplysia californica TaxID=6500 RepID=A0ABM1VTJ7_APLCA